MPLVNGAERSGCNENREFLLIICDLCEAVFNFVNRAGPPSRVEIVLFLRVSRFMDTT